MNLLFEYTVLMTKQSIVYCSQSCKTAVASGQVAPPNAFATVYIIGYSLWIYFRTLFLWKTQPDALWIIIILKPSENTGEMGARGWWNEKCLWNRAYKIFGENDYPSCSLSYDTMGNEITWEDTETQRDKFCHYVYCVF